VEPGERVGRYVILGKLASGGMGELWLARHDGHAGFAKTVVVKTIAENLAGEEGFREMFLDEARLAGLINHPHVLQVFDFGEDGGRYFLAMEYLEGRSLSEVLARIERQKTALPATLAARIIADCCAGLDFAHDFKDAAGRSLGIVHRDVTPANIFLTYSGQVKVLDFGIARARARSHHTPTGVAKGKIFYMAPEQVQGDPVDRRADLWGLGVTLFVMLTGRRPFDGAMPLDVFEAILHAPLPALGLGADAGSLERIVQRALARNREDRYPTAGAMRIDLESYLEHQPSVTGFKLAGLMEELFPVAVDADRRRLAALADGSGATPAAVLVSEKTGPTRELERGPLGQQTETIPALGMPSGEPLLTPRPEPHAASRRVLGASVGGGILLALAVVGWALRPSRAPLLPSSPAPAVAETPTPIVAAAALPPPPSLPARPPGVGSLRVGANIPCEVFVDGQRRGRTPLKLTALSAGRHHVRLVGPATEGILSRDSDVQVAEGTATEHNVSFGKGKLVVRALPWADVRVDGRKIGVTPFPPLVVFEGKHELTLDNRQIPAHRRVLVSVAAGQRQDITVRMDEPE
jgi:tRNA A-37 threonylcarbamoyl transferase component Bud32